MKVLFVILSILIIPGSFNGLLDSVSDFTARVDVLYPFLSGIIGAIALYYVLLNKWYSLQVFEHELTHAVMALLFLRRITSFRSSSMGGYVGHSGGFGGAFGNRMITLAPYYFPTFTVIAALIQPLMPPGFFPWYHIIAGGTLGYHIVSTIDEIKQNYTRRPFRSVGTGQLTETDISKTGMITATITIIALSLFFAGLVFSLFLEGYSGAGSFLVRVYNGASATAAAFHDWLSSLLFSR